jgi:ABC-type amino acid transport substrate-binding protein
MKNNSGFKFASDAFEYNYYGVMVKKAQPEWVDFINKWEQDVKTNGTWKQLYAKNFPGTEVPDPPMPPYDKAYH